MVPGFNLRKLVVTLASVAATGVVGGIISLNVQHYAKGTPLEAALDLLQPFGRVSKAFLTDRKFLIFAALLAGAALSLWADTILRRWAAWRETHSNRIDRGLLAMTAVLVFGFCFALSLFWLAIETASRSPVAEESAAPDTSHSGEQIANLNRQLNEAIKDRDIAQRALASTKKAPPVIDTGAAGPIAWEEQFYWGVTSNGSPEYLMAFTYIRGKNIGSAPVRFTSATLTSGLTGATQDLSANIPGGAVPIKQINAVPPGATIDLIVEWKPMIPIKTFLSEWGKMTFRVAYEGGNYDATYDEAFILSKATREFPDQGFGPRVTKKASVNLPIAEDQREFTARTARELMALYDGLTPLQAAPLMQPYKGKWIKVQGRVINLLADGMPGASIAVLMDDNIAIECRLDHRWKEKVAKVSKGDTLAVQGQISEQQNGSQLYLQKCELF